VADRKTPITCPQCYGEGQVWKPGSAEPVRRACPMCGGSKKVWR